jgi:hypothetical protein
MNRKPNTTANVRRARRALRDIEYPFGVRHPVPGWAEGLFGILMLIGWIVFLWETFSPVVAITFVGIAVLLVRWGQQ